MQECVLQRATKIKLLELSIAYLPSKTRMAYHQQLKDTTSSSPQTADELHRTLQESCWETFSKAGLQAPNSKCYAAFKRREVLYGQATLSKWKLHLICFSGPPSQHLSDPVEAQPMTAQKVERHTVALTFHPAAAQHNLLGRQASASITISVVINQKTNCSTMQELST